MAPKCLLKMRSLSQLSDFWTGAPFKICFRPKKIWIFPFFVQSIIFSTRLSSSLWPFVLNIYHLASEAEIEEGEGERECVCV